MTDLNTLTQSDSGFSVHLVDSVFDFDLVIDNLNGAPIFSSTSADAAMFSDFCAFVDMQNKPLEGIFYLKDLSDVFTGPCAEATFLFVAQKLCNKHGIYVKIYCDNNQDLHVDSPYGEFFMTFHWNGSALVMNYVDSDCNLTKNFNLTGMPIILPSKHRLEQNQFSDCSDFPYVHVPGLVDCALICVDVDSPVTQIDCVDCIAIDSHIISDAARLCDLVHCACEIEHCLEELYGDISDKVDHRCCLTYTGPVGAIRVRVDLENCRIFYEDFFIPGCSDINLK